MKKSYFAIGAIAAAMCSCSSESIPSAGEGNVLPGTEDLSPISLSMTGKQTTVEVGSRTRGTGNVGGDDDANPIWQNEKLYILMTSSDVRCLKDYNKFKENPDAVVDDPEDPNDDPDIIIPVDGDRRDETRWTGWGFTTLNGNGPWLREQFNGAIWARPKQNGDAWSLVYKHTKDLGNNDWYKGAGVDRFYPINGESQFFAFHIDDAFNQAEGNNTPIYPASIFEDASDYHYPQQDIVDRYPNITKNEAKTEMTVDFTINGSQDLLAGKATPEAPYENGFSAKSARHGVVPNIEMKHLLSRLKFIIYRGDELAKNIQITGITIKEVKNTGKMIVAYKTTPSNNDLIIWNDATADFKLMQSPDPIVDNTDPDQLVNDKNPLEDLDPINVSEIEDWMQEPVPGDPTQTQRKDGNDDGDTDDVSMEAGAGMFVAPGQATYEMVLDYKVLVRDGNGNGVIDEPLDSSNPVGPTDPANPTDGTDLIEKMQVTYTLTAPEGGFKKGNSYNINITVYGLQPITATVELTEWEEGGDLWIGGDDTGDDDDDTNDKPENLNP